MPRSDRFPLALLVILAWTAGCVESTPAAPEDDPPDGPGGDPTARLECERQGYPCSWTGVDRAVFERSDQLGDDVLEMFEEGRSPAEALTWIAAQAGVAEAAASDVAVRFRLEGGRPTWVLGRDALIDGAEPHAHPPRAAAGKALSDVVGDAPTDKRALIVAPYNMLHQAGPAIANLFRGTRDYRGNVDLFMNIVGEERVQLEHFHGWGDYDAVFLQTHGNHICDDGRCHTVVGIGEFVGVLFDSNTPGLDLVKLDYGVQQAGLNTDFFLETYPEGLPNTIVFIASCLSLGGDDLAQALTRSGGVYLGWSTIVWNAVSAQAAVQFFTTLIEGGVPAGEAFASLPPEMMTQYALPGGGYSEFGIVKNGNDLRAREVVWLRHPTSEQDLPVSDPYPVIGVLGDGEPDRIPYLVKVDGVMGNPAGFTVHVEVNGLSGEPQALASGEPLDPGGNVWQVHGDVPVTFDVEEGQELHLRAWVTLPEGGTSEWDERVSAGGPVLRFVSEIESVAPADGGQLRIFGKVETEVQLALGQDLEILRGESRLEYVEFSMVLPIPDGCSLSTSKTGGTLRIVEVVLGAQGGLPQEVVLAPLPDTHESYTVSCPEGSHTFQSIHWFSGFYAFHGGEMCGAPNEFDESRGGLVLSGWTSGSGEVAARKVYDRSCTLGEATHTERTTIELVGVGGAGASAGAPPRKHEVTDRAVAR